MTYDHTENKRLYCEDWIETDRPWERWECLPYNSNVWLPLAVHPEWRINSQYRRIDPYAELKKGWICPPNEYKVRDKPKDMDKPKAVKYLCYEATNGALFWLREDKVNGCTSKRVPQFDKELT